MQKIVRQTYSNSTSVTSQTVKLKNTASDEIMQMHTNLEFASIFTYSSHFFPYGINPSLIFIVLPASIILFVIFVLMIFILETTISNDLTKTA